jgi:hypothetical protein
MPICRDIPYNRTIFPNMMGHSSQEDAIVEVNQVVERSHTLVCTKMYWQISWIGAVVNYKLLKFILTVGMSGSSCHKVRLT